MASRTCFCSNPSRENCSACESPTEPLSRSPTASRQAKVWGIARPGQKPVVVASGFRSPIALCLEPPGKFLLVVDKQAGTLTRLPTSIPGHEIDQRPLPLQSVPAFPKLNWTGWKGITEQGKVVEHRPILLTHAGDGSQRNFVAIQQGTIHVFPNDVNAE